MERQRKQSIRVWIGFAAVLAAGWLTTPLATRAQPPEAVGRIQKSMTTSGGAPSTSGQTANDKSPSPVAEANSEKAAPTSAIENSDAGGFIRANVVVEPDRVTFGDTLRYRVEVTWKGDYTVDSIEPPGDLTEFMVTSKGVPDTDADTDSGTGDGGGGGVCRQTFLLRAVGAGTQAIPAFTVTYRRGASGPAETLTTPVKSVTVDPPKSEGVKGEPRPLAPAQAIPFDWTLRNLILGGAVVLILLLAWLAWVLLRRMEARREAMRPPAPPRPAHVIAYEELDALAHSTYLRDGRFKLYFTDLSEILRRYVQNRYGVPALDWTTYEIVEALGRLAEPSENDRSRLGTLLDVCDLVKFAKWTPPDNAGENAMRDAVAFVDTTRIQNRLEAA